VFTIALAPLAVACGLSISAILNDQAPSFAVPFLITLGVFVMIIDAAKTDRSL
jgi:hypothetical protein